MTAFTVPVSSAAMPRREPAPSTEPVNLRLKVATKELLEEYRRRWPLNPTMTSIVEAALAEWFARNPLPPDSGERGGDPRLGQRGKR